MVHTSTRTCVDCSGHFETLIAAGTFESQKDTAIVKDCHEAGLVKFEPKTVSNELDYGKNDLTLQFVFNEQFVLKLNDIE